MTDLSAAGRAPLIRAAVIGAGWWSGRVHVPTLLADERVELVVVCDRDPVRAEALARSSGARTATTVEEVLAREVDVAVVATPHDTHAQLAQRLLETGIDTLVEKPLTLDARSAWRLVAAADRTGAVLHTGFTYVHSEQIAFVRDLVRRGEIGRVSLVSVLYATAVRRLYAGSTDFQGDEEGDTIVSLPDTYSDPRRAGGHLWAQTVHPLSVVLWATGRIPVTVSAFTDTDGLSVDVTDALTVEFADGGFATIASSGLAPSHALRTEAYHLFGSEGSVRFDTVSGTVKVMRGVAGAALESRRHRFDPATTNPVAAAVRTLVTVRRDRSALRVEPALGAWVTAVSEAAQRSAETQQRVTVEGPPAAPG